MTFKRNHGYKLNFVGKTGIVLCVFLFCLSHMSFGAIKYAILSAAQDTFPVIFIDTTETEEAVEFTTETEFSFDTISAANSIEEFQKKIGASNKAFKGKKASADHRSTPFIVQGEVVASFEDKKTKKNAKRLWKEIDPAEEIRRQLENNKMLLGRYEKNLEVAKSIKNDRLAETMEMKIDKIKDRIKDQKRALRKVK